LGKSGFNKGAENRKSLGSSDLRTLFAYLEFQLYQGRREGGEGGEREIFGDPNIIAKISSLKIRSCKTIQSSHTSKNKSLMEHFTFHIAP
jgi:hypothetical protein